MTMDRHEELQVLLDFVLGDLPASDRQRVEVHLQECPGCAAQAGELEESFQVMGLATEPMAPPLRLRSRVLESFEHVRRAGGQSAVTRLPARRRPWFADRAVLALAAALVLVLGGLLTLETARSRRLADDLRRVHDEVSGLSSRIAETSVQADLAVTILTATDMRRIDLEGQDGSRRAVARGYWSPAKGLLIVADRLPPPPAGRTYQVWLIGSSSAGPVSAGLMEGATPGRGMLIVPAPGGVTGSTVTIAVTDEPLGGQPAPTGVKHLVGSL